MYKLLWIKNTLRKLKPVFSHVESLNASSVITGSNCIYLEEKKGKKISKLNLALLNWDLGKTGVCIFNFKYIWDYVTFFAVVLKILTRYLPITWQIPCCHSRKKKKNWIEVLLRMVTAYARVWTHGVNCVSLCSKLHNVCLIWCYSSQKECTVTCHR